MSETFTVPYYIDADKRTVLSVRQKYKVQAANTGEHMIVVSICKEISNNMILDINKSSLPVFYIT